MSLISRFYFFYYYTIFSFLFRITLFFIKDVFYSINQFHYFPGIGIFCTVTIQHIEIVAFNKLFRIINLLQFFTVRKSIASNFIDIIGKGNTKQKGIEAICKHFKINQQDTYAFGDSFNDIDMLKDYNGYTFPWCKSEVKNVSKGRCLSVASLIKKISR